MARRVLMAEVNGGLVRGRPRLGWMDGVKVALGNRGMTVEAAREIVKSGEPWYIWFLFLGSFLNSCGCSTAKSKTPPQGTICFYPLTGTELGSQLSLTTRDRELVSVLEVRIEPGDLNPRPLTP